MSHFAHLDPINVVDQIIVAEPDFIQSLINADRWIQISYNTRNGVHYGSDGQPDNGIALRENYACIGYFYDIDKDIFSVPQGLEPILDSI